MEHELAEKFISIQGEALYVGKRSLFLRYSFCNLSCSFCDTPQKEQTNYLLKTEEIINEIKQEDIFHVVITGGEPLLKKTNLQYLLTEILNQTNCDIEVETNGTLLTQDLILKNEKVRYNISPKIAFASKYTYLPVNEPNCIFKFPVDKHNLEQTREFIKQFNIPLQKIYYMPICQSYLAYVMITNWVLDKALEDKVNFSPRLQLIQNVK